MSSAPALEQYADRNTLAIGRQIGFGIHGKVWTLLSPPTGFQTAAKIFEEETPFERELSVYRRLEEGSVFRVGRCNVPILVDFDTDLLLIRMTLVERPFCLDFASAYLDDLPPYFPPFDEEWRREKENQFGPDQWPEALSVLRELESHGIFQTDVSPSNIAL